MIIIKKLLYYLNPLNMFRLRQKGYNFNTRMMEIWNFIAIYLFIFGLIYLFIRYY